MHSHEAEPLRFPLVKEVAKQMRWGTKTTANVTTMFRANKPKTAYAGSQIFDSFVSLARQRGDFEDLPPSVFCMADYR
jgi:hypothetical protein